ncbi:MAG: CBS domain-containing protein [Actinobacteria bacterium]|nr:CBS domain-containing protein [Actinomycetota bacterium]
MREALVSDPRVLAADALLRDAAELLLRPNVRSALVVDGDRLLGCVTLEGIARAVAADADVRRLTVGEVCEADVTTIGPETPLDEALHLMVERGLDRLAVTEDGRLVGVLPREPVLRRLAEDEAPPPDDEPLGLR